MRKTVITNRKGSSLTEFGLMTALVTVVVLTAIPGVRPGVVNTFDGATQGIAEAAPDDAQIAPPANGGGVGQPVLDPSNNCFDPANVGVVAPEAWQTCAGMLIVDNAMLASSGSAAVGGDESFAILGPDGNLYSFEDSARNVFVGQVTTLSRLFQSTAFNGDIGSWYVDNVETMEMTFSNNAAFNQNLNNWVTSSLTRLDRVFQNASAYNQPMSNWNTGSVINMEFAFANSTAFNQDLSGWCVSGLGGGTPASFDSGATSWTLARPNFATPPC